MEQRQWKGQWFSSAGPDVLAKRKVENRASEARGQNGSRRAGRFHTGGDGRDVLMVQHEWQWRNIGPRAAGVDLISMEWDATRAETDAGVRDAGSRRIRTMTGAGQDGIFDWVCKYAELSDEEREAMAARQRTASMRLPLSSM